MSLAGGLVSRFCVSLAVVPRCEAAAYDQHIAALEFYALLLGCLLYRLRRYVVPFDRGVFDVVTLSIGNIVNQHPAADYAASLVPS